MCLPASARTSVYAALWLFWGMFRKPTELVPSTVQLLKVPEAGVPSTGAVNVLLVSVCEVFVLATSVKVLLPNAMVLLVSVCEVFVLATSVKVLLPNAIVLLVTVFVLVAVRTLVGVMMLDRTAMTVPYVVSLSATGSGSSR